MSQCVKYAILSGCYPHQKKKNLIDSLINFFSFGCLVGGRSGFVAIGSSEYGRLAHANEIAAGASIPPNIEAGTSLASYFPSGVAIGSSITESQGYFNPVGGWADAEMGIQALLDKVRSMGSVVRSSANVIRLKFNTTLLVSSPPSPTNVTGVYLDSGEIVAADVIIIATGSWTPSLFPDPSFGITSKVASTGQTVGMVQLTPEEAREFQDVPVVMNWDTGFYVFPVSWTIWTHRRKSL